MTLVIDDHYDRDNPATFRTRLHAEDVAGYKGRRFLADEARHKEFARTCSTQPSAGIPKKKHPRSICSVSSELQLKMMRWFLSVVAWL